MSKMKQFENITHKLEREELEMKTIKIIDLFIRMANDKEMPKKIKYMNSIYTYDDIYEDNWKYSIKRNGTTVGLLEDNMYYSLNDEVEILDENKI